MLIYGKDVMSDIKLLPLLPNPEYVTDLQVPPPGQVKAELLGILALTLYLARIEQSKKDSTDKGGKA